MTGSEEYNRILRVESYVKKVAGAFRPKVAVVLGSGLGNYGESESVTSKFELPYSEIPGFPVSTVPGHAGKFIFSSIEGVPVVLMQGRVHMYEGYSAADTVLPIRVLRMLGVSTLILTNAAGGMNPDFHPGDFMLIRDHISSFVPSPLRGANLEELGERFPDMTEVYSRDLIAIAKETATSLGIALQEGVYLQTPGPQYETPAEIRMMTLLGADAVGMSTVCEAIAAHHMGMRICGISCITNLAAGLNETALSHAEVQEAAGHVEQRFQRLMTALIAKTVNL
ncbi:MAG: purine-nucleoside phosphorylase [Clostridiales bacterium]|jgi:purine nucleoside phosphorylase I, inosine and guanosine-specific|nr:purine-nucleoside phosphorylase [Clostridiales bacterium]